MTRAYFDQELDRLKDELMLMSSRVNHGLRECIEVLKGQDESGARRLIKADEDINRQRYQIESDALMLITTQQPVAKDLRMIAAFLDISGELERIGDYAKGIAIITTYIGSEPLLKPLVDIPKMGALVTDMLQDALDAFISQDEIAARSVPPRDDEVDALYNLVHRDLLNVMLEHPDKIDQANYLLWAAHNLERAADRVTNICERVVFTVTGEMVELDGYQAEPTDTAAS